MLSIAINRAKHVCATVIIEHNYFFMCNHKIVIDIMLCLLNSTGHKSRSIVDLLTCDNRDIRRYLNSFDDKPKGPLLHPLCMWQTCLDFRIPLCLSPRYNAIAFGRNNIIFVLLFMNIYMIIYKSNSNTVISHCLRKCRDLNLRTINPNFIIQIFTFKY